MGSFWDFFWDLNRFTADLLLTFSGIFHMSSWDLVGICWEFCSPTSFDHMGIKYTVLHALIGNHCMTISQDVYSIQLLTIAQYCTYGQ